METTQKTVLHVEGMTCNHCVRAVTSALCDLEGVRGADVHLQGGRVVVEHGPQGPAVAAMLEAIREAGYEPSAEQAA